MVSLAKLIPPLNNNAVTAGLVPQDSWQYSRICVTFEKLSGTFQEPIDPERATSGNGKARISARPIWSNKKNKLHQYKTQLSQHFLYMSCLLKPSSISIACLPLFLISPSSPSLPKSVVSGVHWSLVERFRDLGHSDLTGSYSRQVRRTNNP